MSTEAAKTANVVKLQLPTATLMALLGENPDIMAELQARGIEKVAEELFRKVKKASIESFDERAEKKFSQMLQDIANDFKQRYRFPKEGTDAIKREIEERWKDHFRQELQNLYADLRKYGESYLERRIGEEVENVKRRLREDIRKIAREEFVAVMQEVKANV